MSAPKKPSRSKRVRPLYWILDDDSTPVPVDDVRTWAEWFETVNRRIEYDVAPDGRIISTVFLGIDHGFVDGGPPLLFETMTFDRDGRELACLRSSTVVDARIAHADACFRAGVTRCASVTPPTGRRRH